MMDDIWWQDDEEFVKSGVSPDRDHEPIRVTKVGNATRAEGREQDIKRYKSEIEKAKRKKMMLRRFKDESKIGCALGKLNKTIRFYRDMIAKTRRVGNYDYPKIYGEVRKLIIQSGKTSGKIARNTGISKATIHNLRSKRYREVSKHSAHNAYEVLKGMLNREEL